MVDGGAFDAQKAYKDYVCMHILIHINTYIYIYIYVFYILHKSICICISLYMNTYIYIYIYMHKDSKLCNVLFTLELARRLQKQVIMITI